MRTNELFKFNSTIFETLERKCRQETKFGKVANALLFVLFRIVKNLKQFRHRVQVVLSPIEEFRLNRIRKKLNSYIEDAPLPPSRPWHYPCSIKTSGPSYRRVTIIAELSIPQCTRYRVEQKAQALFDAGNQVKILSFTDLEGCWRELSFSDLVIFYRTPYWRPVQGMIEECRRIGVPTIYDIDDLVFDLEIYKTHPVFKTMKKEQVDDFLRGGKSYGDCLSACDHFIASTPTLFNYMSRYSKGKGWVVENALDSISLNVASISEFRGKGSSDLVYIGYGSGTKSHDEDFAIAKNALIRVLKEHPNARLVLFGHLNISSEFEAFGARVERHPLLEAKQYLLRVAELDINLAPLTHSIFNDAKSNIKFLEAAASGVVTIASPSQSFREIIRHGENGFLATTEDEWFECLSQLIESRDLRIRVGKQAKADVFARYSPEQTKEVLNTAFHTLIPKRVKTHKNRVLIVNCLFTPFTFGGATLVAEKTADELQDAFEVAVFTGNNLPELPEYAVFKYEAHGMLVYSIKQSMEFLMKSELLDPRADQVFQRILEEFKPEVVHFHAIQGLSVSMVDLCKLQDIATVVTMHDAWWFCARQFMQMPDGKFCGQFEINYRICGACTGSLAKVSHRQSTLMAVLKKVDLILAPSEFHLKFIQANLPSARNIKLNKNGYQVPSKPIRREDSPVTRFAFIGGINAEHKGYFALKNAIESIPNSNFELFLVDLNRKLHGIPHNFVPWKSTGTIRLVPPFDSLSIDEFYSQIDVLITPSQIPESFGLAVREALARGVWVITTDAGGLAEEVTEGVNGNVVAMQDAGELRRVILEAISCKPLSKKILSTLDKSQANELKRLYSELI